MKTTEILRKYNIRPKKNMGQNFLTDEFVIGKIVMAADIDKNTTVIEIGSGLGALTKELIKLAAKVYAIELDAGMCHILKNEYGHGEYGEKLEIINDDALMVDIAAIVAKEQAVGRTVNVCANLPYYITTPILMFLLEKTAGISRMTLMMQKDVADRILAKPGSKQYGAITPSVNYYSSPSLLANVPPNCFIPRPGVHSAVVTFDILKDKPVHPKDEKLMKLVIKAAFGQRRKTVLNALYSALSADTGLSKQDFEKCLSCLKYIGVQGDMRGENFDIKQFAAISDAIWYEREKYKGERTTQ